MTQYGSCLYPLWNRAAGDCLLDSVLQATWGVFDRDNFLRRRLYEALSDGYQRLLFFLFYCIVCSVTFYPESLLIFWTHVLT